MRQTKFFVILDRFLPFQPPNNPKNQNFEKLKKSPGVIIILHKCTKNPDHMLCCSLDIARNGFKGHLCYKMITSQNVSLRYRLRIFLFLRKVPLCSQDIQVFVFLTIPSFTKSVTPWVLVHETGCICEYIFWTTTHEVTKLGQLIDINKGNNFQESFEQSKD